LLLANPATLTAAQVLASTYEDAAVTADFSDSASVEVGEVTVFDSALTPVASHLALTIVGTTPEANAALADPVRKLDARVNLARVGTVRVGRYVGLTQGGSPLLPSPVALGTRGVEDSTLSISVDGSGSVEATGPVAGRLQIWSSVSELQGSVSMCHFTGSFVNSGNLKATAHVSQDPLQITFLVTGLSEWSDFSIKVRDSCNFRVRDMSLEEGVLRANVMEAAVSDQHTAVAVTIELQNFANWYGDLLLASHALLGRVLDTNGCLDCVASLAIKKSANVHGSSAATVCLSDDHLVFEAFQSDVDSFKDSTLKFAVEDMAGVSARRLELEGSELVENAVEVDGAEGSDLDVTIRRVANVKASSVVLRGSSLFNTPFNHPGDAEAGTRVKMSVKDTATVKTGELDMIDSELIKELFHVHGTVGAVLSVDVDATSIGTATAGASLSNSQLIGNLLDVEGSELDNVKLSVVSAAFLNAKGKAVFTDSSHLLGALGGGNGFDARNLDLSLLHVAVAVGKVDFGDGAPCAGAYLTSEADSFVNTCVPRSTP